MRKFRADNLKGIGIIEILVAAALFGLVLAALMSVGNFALKLQNHAKNNLIAINLASEGIEAAKMLKEEGWSYISGLSLESAYHPVISGNPLEMSLASGGETIDSFSRSVVLSQVFRDAQDDIVSSGGILDSETKRITATVSWNEGAHHYEVILVYYLANWR